MRCAYPGCERFVNVYKFCHEHRGLKQVDLVTGEHTYYSEADQEKHARSFGSTTLVRHCAHGFASWTDCPACTEAYDFDEGQVGTTWMSRS
jgi:hypothetical protein